MFIKDIVRGFPKRFDFGNISILEKDISTNGLKSNIKVYRANGKTHLLDGERRLRALEKLGVLEVSCDYVDVKTSVNITKASFLKNDDKDSKPLTQEELAVALDSLRVSGEKLSVVARTLGMAKSKLSKPLSLLLGKDELLEYINT